MGSRTRRVTGALAVASLLGLAATAGADRKTHHVKLEVKLLEVDRTDYRSFTGAIGAAFPCRDDRDVSLWYKPSAGAAPKKLGSDDTNRRGRFEIDLAAPAVAGLYSATVSGEVELRPGHRYVCQSGRSLFVSF